MDPHVTRSANWTPFNSVTGSVRCLIGSLLMLRAVASHWSRAASRQRRPFNLEPLSTGPVSLSEVVGDHDVRPDARRDSDVQRVEGSGRARLEGSGDQEVLTLDVDELHRCEGRVHE